VKNLIKKILSLIVHPDVLSNYLLKVKNIIGKAYDPYGFSKMLYCMHKDTTGHHDQLIAWANSCLERKLDLESPECYARDRDPLVIQGHELLRSIKNEFAGRYKHLHNIRIMIHLPDYAMSPAGYSLFNNFAQGFEFLGIPVKLHSFDDIVADDLKSFKPTVFLTSDSEHYLRNIDWRAMEEYRKKEKLILGLTASLEEYGNTPLAGRLEWGRNHGVNFYYSFRAPEYIAERKEYREFDNEGFPVFNLEFGANPLIHYAVPGIERDLDYIFLASINPDKWRRCVDYCVPIFRDYPGLIHGPGWPAIRDQSIVPARDRFLYARAKVGINLHLQEQIEWACELNERIYILAACGVPQLIDHPGLLLKRFSHESMFVAETPGQYVELFNYMLHNREKAEKKALSAQREVFEKYTIFHSIEKFIDQLSVIFR